MSEQASKLQKAWDAYQAAARVDPFSDETKRKRAAYKRMVTISYKNKP